MNILCNYKGRNYPVKGVKYPFITVGGVDIKINMQKAGEAATKSEETGKIVAFTYSAPAAPAPAPTAAAPAAPAPGPATL